MHKEYYSRYHPVDGVNDDIAKLLDSTEIRHPSKSRLLQLWPWFSHVVLMTTTMVFFILWACAPSTDDVILYCRWINRSTLRILLVTAPANVAIESIGIIRFNTSLGAPSIYRGSPSPELDAAWNDIAVDGCVTLHSLHIKPLT